MLHIHTFSNILIQKIDHCINMSVCVSWNDDVLALHQRCLNWLQEDWEQKLCIDIELDDKVISYVVQRNEYNDRYTISSSLSDTEVDEFCLIIDMALNASSINVEYVIEVALVRTDVIKRSTKTYNRQLVR